MCSVIFQVSARVLVELFGIFQGQQQPQESLISRYFENSALSSSRSQQGLRRSYKIQFGNRENCLRKRNHVFVYENYLPGQGCIRKWCDTNNIEMTEISICNCIFPTTWWGHRCHKLNVFNLSKLKVTPIIPMIPFQIILSIICTVLKKIKSVQFQDC